MRVCLINPPVLPETIILHPPLGLGYIAALLEEKGHEVDVIDMPIEEISYEQLKKRIQKLSPDVIGISVMTKTYVGSIKTASICKEVAPKTPVIMGGPHVTFKPVETLQKCKDVDIVVTYEGEYTMLEIVDHLEKNKKLKNIKGVAFRHGKQEIIKTEDRPPIKDLDVLPYPKRDLFPLKKYLRKDDETTMITARGCPYRCKFCSTTKMGRLLRVRSIDNLIPEIKEILNLGFRSIFVSDDTFTFSKKRVIHFCKEILHHKLDFRWTCNMRIDNAWGEMLKWMKKAGCYRVFVGIESSAGAILSKVDKNLNVDQTIKAVRKIQRHGIEVHASFVLGLPGETEETIKETVNFAKTINPDMISFNILTPYPGTELYEHPEKYGIILTDKYWYEKENWAYTPITGTKEIPPERLVELVREAYIEYCSL